MIDGFFDVLPGVEPMRNMENRFPLRSLFGTSEQNSLLCRKILVILHFQKLNKMKKIVVAVLLLLVMGGVRAQVADPDAPKEYISVVITLASRDVPQDSLDKYGVFVQKQEGVMAYALVPSKRYESLLRARFVTQVTPSTRVYLTDAQITATGLQPETKPDTDDLAAGLYKSERGYRAHSAEDNPNVKHCTPSPANDDQDSLGLGPLMVNGWYAGILLGGSRNNLELTSYPINSIASVGRGLDLDVRAGYKFGNVLGIRTGVQVMSKNYYLTTTVTGIEYETRCNNMYLQVPLMLDISLGNKVVRLHVMGGVFGAYWCSQYRNGYIFSATSASGNGWKRGFEPEFDSRWDAGLAAAAELTIRINPSWQLHFGGDYYYGLTSTMKSPYKASNRTLTYQMGLTYHF